MPYVWLHEIVSPNNFWAIDIMTGNSIYSFLYSVIGYNKHKFLTINVFKDQNNIWFIKIIQNLSEIEIIT